MGGLYRLRPGPVRDFGTERALVSHFIKDPTPSAGNRQSDIIGPAKANPEPRTDQQQSFREPSPPHHTYEGRRPVSKSAHALVPWGGGREERGSVAHTAGPQRHRGGGRGDHKARHTCGETAAESWRGRRGGEGRMQRASVGRRQGRVTQEAEQPGFLAQA